jgi:competence protein ComEA
MVEVVGARRARVRVGLGALAVIAAVGLGCAVLVSAVARPGSVASVARPVAEASGSPGSPGSSAAIFVHILGAVARPGLYELREGDRVVDAVAAAGGFADGADHAQVNLARFLSDGEQITVPLIGATPPGPAGTVNGKVNINTADATALETLPRVGPAMAARIIAWREANGRFTTVDDLRSVSGIGDRTFDALKDLITV